jgi:hypothetical protein
VLIVVLWVCLGLVSVTLLFGHSMMMAFRGGDNEWAGRQAEQAIEGAVRYAKYLLANAEEPGQLPWPETYAHREVPVGRGGSGFVGPEGTPGADRAGIWAGGRGVEAESEHGDPVDVGGIAGMTSELAAAIIDWRDEDDEVTSGGAESETYLLRKPSYACKNAPIRDRGRVGSGERRDVVGVVW